MACEQRVIVRESNSWLITFLIQTLATWPSCQVLRWVGKQKRHTLS